MALPKKHKSLPPDALSPERKRLHERAPAVRVMEQFFQRLGDVLFCIKDRQRRYLWANDAFLQRVPPALRDKFIGRTAAQIFPPLLAAGYEQQDAALLAEGRETHDRLEMISQPDGSTGWFLSEKMLIRSEGGEILAIASMSRDLHLAAEDDPRIASLALALDRMRHDFAEPLRIGDLAAEPGCRSAGSSGSCARSSSSRRANSSPASGSRRPPGCSGKQIRRSPPSPSAAASATSQRFAASSKPSPA
ncbi:MAG: PAS domain-containing protein [Verrucomicrobiales bacterium]